MIRRAQEIPVTTSEKFKGGKGLLISHDILSAEELAPHGRKFGLTVLPPGSSIGDHTHAGDSETYFILKGKARYNDNGTIVEVGPGDMTFCGDGETHGIESIGDEPLEYIALILFTAK